LSFKLELVIYYVANNFRAFYTVKTGNKVRLPFLFNLVIQSSFHRLKKKLGTTV